MRSSLQEKIVASEDNAVQPLVPVLVGHGSAAAAGKESNPQGTKKEESDSPFAVSVTDVYEGPLDLLLDLIRKQDIDIYDIPIARITEQSLAYREKIRELDVQLAAH